ncbi:MAG: hypothetical protein ACI8ZW_001326, partial [Yoonia sp.]
ALSDPLYEPTYNSLIDLRRTLSRMPKAEFISRPQVLNYLQDE